MLVAWRPAIGSGADAKLGAEGVIKIGKIAEAAGKRDIDNPFRPRGQPSGRFAQACSQKILMRCKPGDLPKGAQEVKRAHPRS